MPMMQAEPAGHCELIAHIIWHFIALLQTPPAHACIVGFPHLPVVSQVLSVSTPPVQVVLHTLGA